MLEELWGIIDALQLFQKNNIMFDIKNDIVKILEELGYKDEEKGLAQFTSKDLEGMLIEVKPNTLKFTFKWKNDDSEFASALELTYKVLRKELLISKKSLKEIIDKFINKLSNVEQYSTEELNRYRIKYV